MTSPWQRVLGDDPVGLHPRLRAQLSRGDAREYAGHFDDTVEGA